MSEQGAYGHRLGSRFHQEQTRAIVTRALRKSEIAVTELYGDKPDVPFMSEEIPKEDAFLVCLSMHDHQNLELFEDGKGVLTQLKPGETFLFDLKRDPRMTVNMRHHSIHFYLPRAALIAVADDANVPRISELKYKFGVAVQDDTIRSLGQTMLAALDNPERASRVFVDHVTLAVAVHVAQTYGGMQPRTHAIQGGLAPWQERRAKEMLAANLGGDVALRDVARDCGLSVGHFARAFRQSTGLAPHRWLVRHRVEAAKALLQNTSLSLSEVALRCGFTDQSHFTRTFTGVVGHPPGSWRRQRQE